MPAPAATTRSMAAGSATRKDFWAEAAAELDWIEPAQEVFDPSAGVYGRWFVGGVCNTCYNAVDRHVMAGPRPAGGDHLRFSAHRGRSASSPTTGC